MKEIITDLTSLMSAAKPVKLINDNGALAKDEVLPIINELKEVLNNNANIPALSAPQIGIDARIICIKFKDAIKSFINPVVTKKLKYAVQPETCVSMPGKEILITRPEEITIVYHNDELKYEENKLVGIAARVFDQQYQFLDGITPEALGLISDIEHDGSLFDLAQEEFAQVIEIYKQFVKSKIATLEKNILEDPELEKEYRSLKFSESVINGHAAVVGADKETSAQYKKAQAQAALANKNLQTQKNLDFHSNRNRNLKNKTRRSKKK